MTQMAFLISFSISAFKLSLASLGASGSKLERYAHAAVNPTNMPKSDDRTRQKLVSSKSRSTVVCHAVAFEVSVALLQYLLKMLLLNQKFGIYLMSPSFL
jgi:hypothetical protein